MLILIYSIIAKMEKYIVDPTLDTTKRERESEATEREQHNFTILKLIHEILVEILVEFWVEMVLDG